MVRWWWWKNWPHSAIAIFDCCRLTDHTYPNIFSIFRHRVGAAKRKIRGALALEQTKRLFKQFFGNHFLPNIRLFFIYFEHYLLDAGFEQLSRAPFQPSRLFAHNTYCNRSKSAHIQCWDVRDTGNTNNNKTIKLYRKFISKMDLVSIIFQCVWSC